MREFKRQDRLRDQIKREVADILLYTVKNPKLGFVTVTGVEVSKDLKYAKVFYTAMGSNVEKAQSARTLERVKGVIRAELGKRLKLRSIPILSFHIDRSLDYGEKIDSLLDEIKRDDGLEDDD
jgi:ribosome-binding factor A